MRNPDIGHAEDECEGRRRCIQSDQSESDGILWKRYTAAMRMMDCDCFSAGPERMTSTSAGQSINVAEQSRNNQAHIDHDEAMRMC